jgi:minor extracellular serine protease Vpr
MKEAGVKKILIFVLVAMLSMFFFAGSDASVRKISSDINLNSSEPVKVIVELSDLPVSAYKKTFKYKLMRAFNRNIAYSYEKQLITKQKKVFNSVRFGSSKFGYSFTYVFNGFSCTVSPDGIRALAKLRDVKRIYPDRKAYLLRQKADQVIGVNSVRQLKDANGNPLTGKGIVVGIVDTGVDYNDAELGGGSFPNSKVIGGYDFADNDSDPMDKDGHGTHVAGIIAGTKYGVAPGVKIRAYRVFGTDASATSQSLIIKGIDQAVADHCDVINISIGTTGGSGNGSDPESIAVENAVKNGVVVVAAAGNWGSRSDVLPFPIGLPGSNREAIGVGASDDSEHPIIHINGKEILGSYADNSPMFNDGNYQVVYCGYGRKEDIKNVNVSGKIALVKRGIIYFGDKDLNLKKAGAVGVICFNNLPGLPSIKLQSETNPNAKDFIPFLFISNSEGRYVKSALSVNNKVEIENKFGLGLIANFSSEGPTKDFYFKPDLIAPGVNISSTVSGNKTESWSGTSMAAPFVSGAAALLLQSNPNLSPAEVKALLMNSAVVLTNPDSGKPFSPLLQGAGRINIYNAVLSNVVITPPSVIFGSGEKTITKEFTAKNFSSNVLVLSVSEKAFSNESLSSVSVPHSIVLPPHGSYTFTVKFAAPSTAENNIYGAIFFSGGGSELHIPYIYVPEFNIPQPLGTVTLSTERLNAGSSANLSFSVNVGAEDKENETSFTENVADEVKVNLFNSKGELIRTIFDKSPIFIGQYTVPIETVSSDGNYLLSNGRYFYKVSYLETNSGEDKGSRLFVEKAEKTGSFTLFNAPENKIYISTDNGEELFMKNGKVFNVYLALALQKPIMNLNFTLNYDASLIQLTDVRSLLDGVKLNYSSSRGVIHGTLSGNLGNNKKIVKFTFKSVDTGESILSLSSISYYPTDQKIVVLGKYFSVSDNPHPWDLNSDNVINNQDLKIFEQSFGLNKYDKGFNEKCDFNNDKKVDSSDFFILMRHFGERYP